MSMELTNLKESAETVELYKGILQFQSKFINAPRDKANEHTGKRYTTLESLNDWTRDHLQAAGLVVMQFPHTPEPCEKIALEWNGGKNVGNKQGLVMMQAVTTRIVHAATGQFVQATCLFIPEPGTGQTTYHATGAGITYFKRQMFMSMLSIVGDEDLDGNAMQAPAERGQQVQQPPQKPKDYSKPPERSAPPKQEPQKQPDPPAATEIDELKADLAEGLEYWTSKKCGWTASQLLEIRKRLATSCAISSEDDEQWIADDYRTFMARMDFEQAKKDWAVKGMTEDGVQELVNGLHADKEINSNFIDKLNADGYAHVIQVGDATLGIKAEG